MKRIKVRRVCVVNTSQCDQPLISFKYKSSSLISNKACLILIR